jgi:8-oxo-dGTP pyrophosphatase MutT (NUDIX family)
MSSSRRDLSSVDEGSAVVLIDPSGRVLLQQRDDPMPPEGVGRWAIPGGHREGDESARATALREFEEETGARLTRLRFFRTFAPGALPALGNGRLHLFFADDDVPRERMQVNEGLDFQYWSPAETETLRMNPAGREMLRIFLDSDKYTGTVATKAVYKEAAAVLAIDRWGRVLLQLRDADLPPERYPSQWSLPGGIMDPGEPPDAAALREFEEETGQLLENLRLFRAFRRGVDLPESSVDVQHVYYDDPDLDESLIEINEGQSFRHFAPDQIDGIPMPPHARHMLRAFFESPAYRAMFH